MIKINWDEDATKNAQGVADGTQRYKLIYKIGIIL